MASAVGLMGTRNNPAYAAAKGAVISFTKSLAIDFGNGARREFAALPWSDGLTLGKLMREARDFRPGIRYTQRGEGDMAFLTALEGVANDKAAGRYWFYEVDGQRGEVSFEVQPLEAGAKVLWVFKKAD